MICMHMYARTQATTKCSLECISSSAQVRAYTCMNQMTPYTEHPHMGNANKHALRSKQNKIKTLYTNSQELATCKRKRKTRLKTCTHTCTSAYAGTCIRTLARAQTHTDLCCAPQKRHATRSTREILRQTRKSAQKATARMPLDTCYTFSFPTPLLSNEMATTFACIMYYMHMPVIMLNNTCKTQASN